MAELTWEGQKGMKGEYQAARNRMERATIGAFRSTLLGIVAAESALTPARALLDRRQARFSQCLLARPEGGEKLREVTGLQATEREERQM